MTEVAEGVRRLGSSWVNWYVLEEEGAVTVVDTGLPAYRDQLPDALRSMGRDVGDVHAIVLTHWHADHVGCAEWLRAETGAAVWAPAGDAPLITGAEKGHRPNFLPYLWRPAMVRYLGHVIRAGATRIEPVGDVRTYGDGETLDVPGRLRAIAAPGHTGGHSALACDDRGVLFCGDALATVDVLRWEVGPRPLPKGVNEDSEQVLASLERLEELDHATVLAGHGEPWTEGAAAAARRAREAGVP